MQQQQQKQPQQQQHARSGAYGQLQLKPVPCLCTAAHVRSPPLAPLQLRFNKVSELIHNSTHHRALERACVTVHFQEIIDKVRWLCLDGVYWFRFVHNGGCACVNVHFQDIIDKVRCVGTVRSIVWPVCVDEGSLLAAPVSKRCTCTRSSARCDLGVSVGSLCSALQQLYCHTHTCSSHSPP